MTRKHNLYTLSFKVVLPHGMGKREAHKALFDPVANLLAEFEGKHADYESGGWAGYISMRGGFDGKAEDDPETAGAFASIARIKAKHAGKAKEKQATP